jgi:uncharacterized membrane protein
MAELKKAISFVLFRLAIAVSPLIMKAITFDWLGLAIAFT